MFKIATECFFYGVVLVIFAFFVSRAVTLGIYEGKKIIKKLESKYANCKRN